MPQDAFEGSIQEVPASKCAQVRRWPSSDNTSAEAQLPESSHSKATPSRACEVRRLQLFTPTLHFTCFEGKPAPMAKSAADPDRMVPTKRPPLRTAALDLRLHGYVTVSPGGPGFTSVLRPCKHRTRRIIKQSLPDHTERNGQAERHSIACST